MAKQWVGPGARMPVFGPQTAHKRRFSDELTNGASRSNLHLQGLFDGPTSEQITSATGRLSTAIARGHFLRNGTRDHRANRRVRHKV
jgi:hypothetical protein